MKVKDDYFYSYRNYQKQTNKQDLTKKPMEEIKWSAKNIGLTPVCSKTITLQ